MEFLRRHWLQARALFDQLTPSQKWLMLALIVCMGLSGLLILAYVPRQSLVPITSFAGKNQAEVVARLKAENIEVTAKGGQIYVPANNHLEAISILQSSELLNEDTSIAFDQLIKNQSPWSSNEQNRQAYMLALRKTLSAIASKMKGVEHADVFIAKPDDIGFGTTFVKPTASVNVMMLHRKPLDKQMAQAIAGLVAGAIAELEPGDVTVIDANFGRQFSGIDDGEIAPSETFEFLKAQENHYRTKIIEALGYIPGVRVAVNVRNDPMLRKDTETFAYEKSERLTSQESEDIERKTVADRGEPGVRPNTGLSITGSRQQGTTETIAKAHSDFGNPVMVERSTSHQIGQTVTQVSVTVNIPRMYFVGRIKMRGGAAAGAEPTEDDIQKEVQDELPRIEDQVAPLISAADKGVVKAHMIPDPEALLAFRNAGKELTGFAAMVKQPWFQPSVLSGLALLAIMLMFGMVRKSLRQPKLPSVEELAGVPPTLPSEDDLLGEVEEAETGMEGVEVNEGEIQMRKLAEQISEMVRANPAEAANLFNRWVESDD
jgi:flagellar biosynthesis/type III secretory pathway M-ring protein FliF/YscJ